MSDANDIPITNQAGSSAECDFVRENAAAFALQALTAGETDRIVRHLAAHPACQAAIDDALAVTALLPYSMPLLDAPDLSVKLRLFDRIAQESAAPAPHAPVVTAALPLERVSPSPAGVAASAEPYQGVSWLQHLGTVLLAPLCVALLVMSVWAFNLNDELNTLKDQTSNGQLGQTLSTSMEVYAMTSTCKDCPMHGQIGTMPDQKSAVLLAWDLDPSEEHEVWCEEKDGDKWMVSPLDVNANGAAMQTIEFPKPIDGYRRIYVSGGSESASDAPELLVAMPESHEDAPPPSATPTA